MTPIASHLNDGVNLEQSVEPVEDDCRLTGRRVQVRHSLGQEVAEDEERHGRATDVVQRMPDGKSVCQKRFIGDVRVKDAID